MRKIDMFKLLAATSVLVLSAAALADDKMQSSGQMPAQGQITGQPAMAEHQAVAEHQYDRSVTCKFRKGRSDLTEFEKSKLRDLVDRIKARGDIDKAEVAVWSDKAFPKSGKDLPTHDGELASKRIDAIEKYLKDEFKVGDVTTFNMAETSHWLAKMFRTDTAELKSVFSKEGGAPLSREDFDQIKKEGGPSKAVIVISPKVAKNDMSTGTQGPENQGTSGSTNSY